jgi:transcriptional regulator with XRE-family HTH domain
MSRSSSPTDIRRRFAENVMIYRKRAGLSQEDLAFRAGLHRTAISQLERGVSLARIDTVVKLAGALSVPPGDLFKGMAWKPGGPPTGRFIVRTEIG